MVEAVLSTWKRSDEATTEGTATETAVPSLLSEGTATTVPSEKTSWPEVM